MLFVWQPDARSQISANGKVDLRAELQRSTTTEGDDKNLVTKIKIPSRVGRKTKWEISISFSLPLVSLPPPFSLRRPLPSLAQCDCPVHPESSLKPAKFSLQSRSLGLGFTSPPFPALDSMAVS